MPPTPQDQDALYPPKGIPLGGFRLFPTANIDAAYDDNVYRTQTDTASSWYFDEQPELHLNSQWDRHELDLYGGADILEYTNTTSEDQTNWNVGGYGRLDVHNGVFFEGDGGYSTLHEQRTSPDEPGNASKPTPYSVAKADASFEYHPSRWAVVVGGNFLRLDYDPTQLFGAPPLSNADRDEDEYLEFVKLGYEFSPGYATFVRGSYNQHDFDLTVDRNGLRRNSTGYNLDAGLDMQVTHLITGSLFVGYLDETYKGSSLPSISGFDFGANLTWTPTPLWTVRLDASHILNATTLDNASAEDDQQVALHVDLNALPYLTIEGTLSYLDESFPGIGRDDGYLTSGIGLKYSLNEYVAVTAGYTYSRRDSNAVGENYNDNQIMIGLQLQE